MSIHYLQDFVVQEFISWRLSLLKHSGWAKLFSHLTAESRKKWCLSLSCFFSLQWSDTMVKMLVNYLFIVHHNNYYNYNFKIIITKQWWKLNPTFQINNNKNNISHIWWPFIVTHSKLDFSWLTPASIFPHLPRNRNAQVSYGIASGLICVYLYINV